MPFLLGAPPTGTCVHWNSTDLPGMQKAVRITNWRKRVTAESGKNKEISIRPAPWNGTVVGSERRCHCGRRRQHTYIRTSC